MNDEERLETLIEELRRIATARGLRSKEAKAMKQWARSLLKRVDVSEVPTPKLTAALREQRAVDRRAAKFRCVVCEEPNDPGSIQVGSNSQFAHPCCARASQTYRPSTDAGRAALL